MIGYTEMGSGEERKYPRKEPVKATRILPEGIKDIPYAEQEAVPSPISMQSPAHEFQLDDQWLIDPKLLYVGPRIGEGAHGKVYEGKYQDKNVAIKIIQAGDTPEETAKREGRFAREISMLWSMLANIVRVEYPDEPILCGLM